MPLLKTLAEISENQIETVETAVETISQIIIAVSQKHDIEKSEILAQVIKDCLLSNDDNPNHINGIDLFQRCDKCLEVA